MSDTRHRLVELRHDAKLTQEEVARRVRVSARSVAAWESGSALPRRANERRLAKALGVRIDDLRLSRSDTVSE